MANLGSYETQPFARPAPQVKDAGAKPHAPPPMLNIPCPPVQALYLLRHGLFSRIQLSYIDTTSRVFYNTLSIFLKPF